MKEWKIKRWEAEGYEGNMCKPDETHKIKLNDKETCDDLWVKKCDPNAGPIDDRDFCDWIGFHDDALYDGPGFEMERNLRGRLQSCSFMIILLYPEL